MKLTLTKSQLNQIIKEELNAVLKEKYFRPAEFDPRAAKEYPEYAGKLSDIYKSDPKQATSLAGSLDEPIDVETPDTDEPDEQHLSYGTQQFRQESPVTMHGMHTGNIEIYFHTQEKKWFVNYFVLETNQGKNSFVFNPGLSKEFSNFKEALEYYNHNADKKIT